jgi:hypothetical protein
MFDSFCQNLNCPEHFKQLACCSLSTGEFLKWKALFADQCDKQAIRNERANVSIITDMLVGEGDYSSEARGPPQYYDPVRLCAQRAWQGLTSDTQPLQKLFQKADEAWVEFLARVTKAVESKIHHQGAHDILIQTLAYEGATTECRAAINAVKTQKQT